MKPTVIGQALGLGQLQAGGYGYGRLSVDEGRRILVRCARDGLRHQGTIWSHAAVAFATVYTALISVTYYVQLTWVGPRLAAGRTGGLEPFLFTPFDSFLYAVDILGYSFMSLASLFAAMVFTGKGLERVVRTFLIAKGLLLPSSRCRCMSIGSYRSPRCGP